LVCAVNSKTVASSYKQAGGQLSLLLTAHTKVIYSVSNEQQDFSVQIGTLGRICGGEIKFSTPICQGTVP